MPSTSLSPTTIYSGLRYFRVHCCDQVSPRRHSVELETLVRKHDARPSRNQKSALIGVDGPSGDANTGGRGACGPADRDGNGRRRRYSGVQINAGSNFLCTSTSRRFKAAEKIALIDWWGRRGGACRTRRRQRREVGISEPERTLRDVGGTISNRLHFKGVRQILQQDAEICGDRTGHRKRASSDRNCPRSSLRIPGEWR